MTSPSTVEAGAATTRHQSGQKPEWQQDLDTWLVEQRSLDRGRAWLRTHEAFDQRRVPAETLPGWCVQYKVRVYGYAGKPIPEALLREDLDCAVQHHAIFGRLWDRTGGLGSVYGAPGKETLDSIRRDRLIYANH